LTPDGEEVRRDDHDDQSELLLVEHDQHGVGCVTSLEGSFVDPSLNVTLGDLDITHLFHYSVERSHDMMESGLTLFRIIVRRTYVTSHPDPDISGQVMTCVAAVQYGNTVVTSTSSAILTVQCEYH